MGETKKMVAINFATWLEDNAWTAVYSEELKRRAWVDASKEKILLRGSDYHFTSLILLHGKSLEELYEMFVFREAKGVYNKRERAMKLIHKIVQDVKSCGDTEVEAIEEATVVRTWLDDMDTILLCMNLEHDIDAGIPDEESAAWKTFSDVVDSCEKRM